MYIKTRPIPILLTRDPLRLKDTHRLKLKRWKEIFHAMETEIKGCGSNTAIRQDRL